MSSQKIIVNKFGGGILKKELIPCMQKRIKEQISNGFYPIIVISAMPGITNKLISFVEELKENYNLDLIKKFVNEISEQHNQIMSDIGLTNSFYKEAQENIKNILLNLSNELNKSSKINNSIEDKIVSLGEKISATIFTAYLNFSNLKAKEILAENIPIITDNNFKNANIDFSISENNIQNKIKNLEEIIVIPGFTGITKNGEIATLGRGGTDTTACFVGTALRAEKIILWKDVGGVLSADPKIIEKAKTIPFINYYEAEEAGKVIHDKAIPFIRMFQTPVEITSIINPKLKTRIENIKKLHEGAKLLNSKGDLTFILATDENIKLNDLIIIISEIFKKYKIEVTLISNARYSVQIVTDNKNGQLEKAYEELKQKIHTIEKTEASMIYLIGWFKAKDVSNFNDLLVKKGANLLISAFYYENCYRMEAIIKTNDINKIMRSVYKKFIK